jgi:hypothetical protein
MRKDSLPSPGPLSMGVQLHAVMAKAISAIEISGSAGGSGAGKAPYAKQLDTFLVAARAAISGFIDAVVPTIAARISGGYPDAFDAAGNRLPPTQVIRIRTNKQLDPSFLPATTAFAIASPARTVTRVAIDGPDVVLSLSAALSVAEGATATVSYTQPGAATNLRDLSGNVLATSAATIMSSNLVA